MRRISLDIVHHYLHTPQIILHVILIIIEHVDVGIPRPYALLGKALVAFNNFIINRLIKRWGLPGLIMQLLNAYIVLNPLTL